MRPFWERGPAAREMWEDGGQHAGIPQIERRAVTNQVVFSPFDVYYTLVVEFNKHWGLAKLIHFRKGTKG